ncbi:MAG TPA: type I DNA topoisomerase, partial [Vitreimonas sp.]|nr:type I DNA topoisomerase [Vitreimonas sp.]
MPKNLVIVESPAKARTIERYLGDDYRVLASYGHVRDLPDNPGKGKFGVDVDHDFEPEYVISDDRRKQVSEIAKAARGADMVYLATDLDREGEAIAWHVTEAANVPVEKTRRVTFSEITERAIQEAFAHPRGIDTNLVDAQQTRRIVDRLVGYTLSPLLSRKVRGGLSAGRVQSVAVRIVVEREREIAAFVTREYWTLEALLATEAGETFTAELVRIGGEPLDVGDEESAQRHAAALRERRPVVRSVGTRPLKRNPAPPFTTSTLQQEASRKLSFSPKRTMSVAQRLYEGADTPDGHVGLITYMRTDSTAMAGVAMGEAREVIGQRFGERYTMPKGRVYKTRAKAAQEAHESIRPTSFRRDPDSMAPHLKADELRLYRLIWQRALASQMASKEMETTTIELAAEPYDLRASATRTLFDGFAAVYTEGRDDGAEDDAERRLPALAEGAVTNVNDVTPTQHFTEPPPRFTEATLIKALEEHGVGRPSTYAATLSTIQDRGYVRVEERRLHPELIGEIVTDLLVEHFGDYVDLAFTARMEEELDEIARGERQWVPLLRDFYGPLKIRVDEKRRELRRKDFTTEETDETCSEGHPMVIRLGRNGRFLACSTYPEHKESRPLPGEEPPPQEGEGEPCPECGEGTLASKRGRFGPFVGCSRYPECRYIRKEGPPPPDPLPFEVICPKNGDGHLVPRRARRTGNVFWGCSSYPKCDYTTNFEPVGA